MLGLLFVAVGTLFMLAAARGLVHSLRGHSWSWTDGRITVLSNAIIFGDSSSTNAARAKPLVAVYAIGAAISVRYDPASHSGP